MPTGDPAPARGPFRAALPPAPARVTLPAMRIDRRQVLAGMAGVIGSAGLGPAGAMAAEERIGAQAPGGALPRKTDFALDRKSVV